MKRNVSVVHFKFRCNILISGKIIKGMPGSVASGTHCSYLSYYLSFYIFSDDQSKQSVLLKHESEGTTILQNSRLAFHLIGLKSSTTPL